MTAVMTLVLDATTKSIEVVMSGAAATTNPDFTSSYADDTGTALTEGSNDGALNGTTAVTLVAAPTGSTRRVVRTITIQNRDTASVTLTIRLNNNSVLRQIAKVTLAVNDTWTTDGTFDANGNLKTIMTVAPVVSLSSYEPYPINNASSGVLAAQTGSSGAAFFWPFQVSQPVAARHVNVLMSWSSVSSVTGSISQTYNWGIYTRGTGASSTQISLFTSNSFSIQMSQNAGNAFTVSQATTTNDTGYAYSSTNSAASNIMTQYTGLKLFQLLLLTTLTQGQYWFGMMDRMSSAGGAMNLQYSLVGNANTLTGIAPLGSLSSAYSSGTNQALGIGGAWPQAFGSFTSAAQTALPGSIALSVLTAGLTMVPYLSFATTK